MADSGKLSEIVEAAAGALAGGRGSAGSRFLRYALRNAFPVICGLIVTGAATWVADMAATVSEEHAALTHLQFDVDHRFRWTQEALRTQAAEIVALRRLLEVQQVETGVLAYKMDWHHPPPPAGAEVAGAPAAAAIDPEAIAKALADRLGRTAKVHPSDIDRLLRQQPYPVPLSAESPPQGKK